MRREQIFVQRVYVNLGNEERTKERSLDALYNEKSLEYFVITDSPIDRFKSIWLSFFCGKTSLGCCFPFNYYTMKRDKSF